MPFGIGSSKIQKEETIMKTENTSAPVKEKSMAIAMILAFLLSAGGFYVAGAKKGAILFFGCWILGIILMQVSPMIAPITNIVSCFVTYKWLKEYNSGVAIA